MVQQALTASGHGSRPRGGLEQVRLFSTFGALLQDDLRGDALPLPRGAGGAAADAVAAQTALPALLQQLLWL